MIAPMRTNEKKTCKSFNNYSTYRQQNYKNSIFFYVLNILVSSFTDGHDEILFLLFKIKRLVLL